MGQLVRLGTTATLAAGLVAVARQRAEAKAIERGEMTRAATVIDDEPRTVYGPMARRLSTWVPAQPRTQLGWLTGMLWAAPLTLVGLALAALSGTPPQWDPARGCLVTRGVRGPSRSALKAVGAQANAIGHVVLSWREVPSPTLLEHEAVHVRQAERLGPLLFLFYVWLGARYGYRDHPLERAARLGARRATQAT